MDRGNVSPCRDLRWRKAGSASHREAGAQWRSAFAPGEKFAGRPPLANPKQQVTLRLDPDVLEKFRATGRGWQSRINAELRKALGI